jgi:hypothetical protein
MNLARWVPWVRNHQQTAAERAEAEKRARDTEYNLVAPLRAMRDYDYLTGAIREEMARQIKGAG